MLKDLSRLVGSESFEGGISREHSDRSLGKKGLLGSQRGNSMARNQRAFRAQHQKQTGMEGVSEERIQSPSGRGQSIFFMSQWVCERQPAAV